MFLFKVPGTVFAISHPGIPPREPQKHGLEVFTNLGGGKVRVVWQSNKCMVEIINGHLATYRNQSGHPFQIWISGTVTLTVSPSPPKKEEKKITAAV